MNRRRRAGRQSGCETVPPHEGHGEGDTDAALLRSVADGDARALAALYDRHAGWLHARLTRRCADPEVVREVVQAALAGTVALAGWAAVRADSAPDPGREAAGSTYAAEPRRRAPWRGHGAHERPDGQAEMPSIRARASSAPYGCRYGSQRGSRWPVPMMRQARPVGGAGLCRSRQPISTR